MTCSKGFFLASNIEAIINQRAEIIGSPLIGLIVGESLPRLAAMAYPDKNHPIRKILEIGGETLFLIGAISMIAAKEPVLAGFFASGAIGCLDGIYKLSDRAIRRFK